MLVAGMIAHYGKEYIGYAIKGVIESVDLVVVRYTPWPSHGGMPHQPTSGDDYARCPDRERELREAAETHGAGKVMWLQSGFWHNETAQRADLEATCYYHGASEILVLDADEVWPAAYLEHCLKRARETNCAELRVHMDHLWRSFSTVCREPCTPRRILRKNGQGIAYAGRGDPSVLHFGYAIRSELMRYKWAIHGHKAELRPGWFENIWSRWPEVRRDVHPTCTNAEGWWNPEPFDKEKMPAFMREHPYWGMEAIP